MRASVAARRPADNLAARNLYLQGRYHLNQRTDEGLQKALEFFEKAIVEDAQFAHAHSGLADAHSLLAHYGVRAPSLAWATAASSAAAAVMLDGNCAEERTSLAHVKATQDWDWHGAEREFQTPSGSTRATRPATTGATSCLVPLGRLDEALDEMRIAQSLDPVSSIVARDVAMIHAYRRDYEAALEQCDHTIELNRTSRPPTGRRADPGTARDLDEAIAAFQRAIDLSPNSPRMHAALARTLALSGGGRMRWPRSARSTRSRSSATSRRWSSPRCASRSTSRNSASAPWQGLRGRAFDVLALKVDPRVRAAADDPRCRRFCVMSDLLDFKETR